LIARIPFILGTCGAQEGYTARPLLENSEVPFYVAPTIAPVMHSSAAPDYLEHPQSAFDYYQTFGTPSTPPLFHLKVSNVE
jgi:hypothetical protein